MVVPNQAAAVNILIVDDHGIFRDCLTALLDKQPGMKVVGTATNGAEAVDVAVKLKPSVVTMSLLLPTLSGLDASRHIIKALPNTRIVLLSGFHTLEHIYQAFRCGALGYVAKESTGAELITAIRTVLTGNRYVSPVVNPADVDRALGGSYATSPFNSLSDREREVMHLTVSGLSSAETGRILHLSQKTIDTYRSRLMAKLGVSNLAQLIRLAMENAEKALG
jgi:DNA-binding NarL/FixJ family response regulator